MTLNPFKHIDPFGTILLPGLLLLTGAPFLFGYAKPVPVNFAALRNPRRDMIWVAAAGPGINIVLAIASALLFHVVQYLPEAFGAWFARNLINSILINVVLAVFNMLPISAPRWRPCRGWPSAEFAGPSSLESRALRFHDRYRPSFDFANAREEPRHRSQCYILVHLQWSDGDH